jgi:hypothetical protein
LHGGRLLLDLFDDLRIKTWYNRRDILQFFAHFMFIISAEALWSFLWFCYMSEQ